MKKYVALLAVLALTCLASMAFAADVTVGGSIDFRSRLLQDLDLDKDAAGDQAYTQERVRVDINAKAGDNLKAKVTIQNDWDTWGKESINEVLDGTTDVVTSVTTTDAVLSDGTNTFTGTLVDKVSSGKAGRLGLREAWVDFMIPGLPVGVKGGHQLLQLGQGWFYRAMLYGADAWLVYAPMGALTLAAVDVKVYEGDNGKSDDMDAYVLLGSYKINDSNTAGIDVTMANDRAGAVTMVLGLGGPTTTEGQLTNVGLNYTGKIGPVNLKAQVDVQTGTATNGAGVDEDIKFSGNQVVVQASMPMDALTINATIARGSGDKEDTADKNEGIVTLMDGDPHYTLIYEYLLPTAGGMKGFANTTAVSVGVGYKLGDSLSVSLDYWMLQATEKIDDESAIGSEIDAKINWKLYDNLTWNWTIGYFTPGDAYATDGDPATAVQGVLSMKF